MRLARPYQSIIHSQSGTRRSGYLPLALGLLLALPLMLLPLAPAGSRVPGVSPKEKGKQIFTTGTSPSGKEIVAVVSGSDVPGSALPCGSCHGADGKGRPEGGVRPANITWETLAAELKENRPDGRHRPAYDERKLKRAITMGLDPAGERLHASMPRYRMSAEDIESLIAYLKVLGTERESGLTDTTIDIGMPRTAGGTRGAIAAEMEGVVAAYFREINERGGIYNRMLQLHAADAGRFALLGCVPGERDDSMLAQAAAHGEPVVAMRSGWRANGSLMDRNQFYLYPGIAREAAALALHARRHFADTTPGSSAALNGVILHPDEAAWKAPVADIVAEGRTGPTNTLRAMGVPTGADIASLVSGLRRDSVGFLIALVPSATINALLREIDRQGWKPTVLMPGEFGDLDPLDIPRGLEGRVYLSYPSWLETVSPAGMQEYNGLRDRYRLSARYLRSQLSALAGAMVLVEGLKRSGRDLTREKLVNQLEGLFEFDTGLIPPVTFGPNRRIGSDNVYVIAVGAGAKSSSLVGRYAASHTGGNE